MKFTITEQDFNNIFDLFNTLIAKEFILDLDTPLFHYGERINTTEIKDKSNDAKIGVTTSNHCQHLFILDPKQCYMPLESFYVKLICQSSTNDKDVYSLEINMDDVVIHNKEPDFWVNFVLSFDLLFSERGHPLLGSALKFEQKSQI